MKKIILKSWKEFRIQKIINIMWTLPYYCCFEIITKQTIRNDFSSSTNNYQRIKIHNFN